MVCYHKTLASNVHTVLVGIGSTSVVSVGCKFNEVFEESSFQLVIIYICACQLVQNSLRLLQF